VRSTWPRLLLLFVVPFLVYYKTLNFDFQYLWDDRILIVDNPYIRSFNIDNLRAIFTHIIQAEFLPLQMLSFMLDYSLWGLNPAGYHLSNILLHAINTVLLYLVLVNLSGNNRLSLFVAMVFAVHPVNVEVVAWVSQRKTLLASSLFFTSILLYLRWHNKGGLHHYLSSLGVFAMAVLSKPTIIGLPFILLVYEALLKRRGQGRGVLQVIPFLLVSMAGVVLTIWSKLSGTGRVVDTATLTIHTLFGTVYPTMIPVYWRYIGLLLWPVNLSAFYDTTVYNSLLEPVVLLSMALWVLVFALIFFRGGKEIKFWSLWSVFCFLPVSNILPINVYFADRYMYLTEIGVFMCIGRAVSPMITRCLDRSAVSEAVLYLFLLLSINGILTGITYNRMEVWRDDLSLWEDTVEKSPNIYIARINLGAAYMRHGRLREAEQQYMIALRLYPTPEVEMSLKVIREMIQTREGYSPSNSVR